MFYRGTSGGMNLYWLSTPYPNELGSWFSEKDAHERSELAVHRTFFDSISHLSDVERDDALKHHCGRFARNWAANVGRILFSYPFSYAQQSLTTSFYMLPNMFVVVLALFSIILAVLRPWAIPLEIWTLFTFFVISFGGSTLVGLDDRQFWPLVPILGVWMAFVYSRLIRIDLIPDALGKCIVKTD